MDTDESNFINNIFSYLVDSYSYVVEKEKKTAEIETLNSAIETLNTSVEKLKDGIENIFDDYEKSHEDFDQYRIQAMKNLEQIIDQYLSKNSNKILSEISGLNAEKEKASENSTRNMFNFLASSTLKTLSSEIILDNKSGSVLISEKYSCDLNIEYSFQLDSENNEFTVNPYFSSLYTGIRIPVDYSNESNEIVYRYENMDKFIIRSAEISGNVLNSDFESDEDKSVFKFSFDGKSVDILYLQNSISKKILDDAVIMKVINIGEINESMAKLYRILKSLDNSKTKLTELRLDGNDLLSDSDFGKLFYKLIETDTVKNIIKNLPDNSENGEEMSKDFIKHRIHTIGKNVDQINSILFE